jgi:hypothetical protein
MTNAEAREQLKHMKVFIGYDAESPMVKKMQLALDTAIKALEQEPCEDAVSREAVVEYIKTSDAELGHDSENELVVKDILNMPPVTPTHIETVTEFADRCRECGKQKKGKWINKSHTSDCGIKFVASECTCCGKKTFFDCDQLVYNYCPNCGAEMEVEE